ncbi:MAG TPA: molybdate ABC transporter substrate-binding protein [Pyrinomonadaceae bacterium]|jgi:molybdate transport system substrate-binding protein|nr:molybdate ABC transporter substrate-binding protein [Pyrinomonadaceae bacterium]
MKQANTPNAPLSVLFTLCFIFALCGCGRNASEDSAQNSQEGAQNSQEILVAAAANLTDAFAELGREFTAQTNVRVVYSFGATADLAKQVRNGAPFDVFASADVAHVEELERAGLLTNGSRALYARGSLVLWSARGGRVRLLRLEDLARADVEKIAVAKPDVAPYGRAAVEALRALNLWEQVEPKVVYAQNVSQARQFAATKNADAAFLPRALVKAGEGESIEVAESLHGPIEQELGIVRASQKQEAALRFARFVLSPEGQALLERYGYRRADDK